MGRTLKIIGYIDFRKCDNLFPVYIYNGSVDRLREVNVLLEVADSFVQSGNIKAAILAMRHTLCLLPRDPKLFNMFASIFFFASKYEQMIECLNCAIELAPRNSYLYIHRAWAWAHLDDFEEARKDIYNALDLSKGRASERAYCTYRAGVIEYWAGQYRGAAKYFWLTAMLEPLSADYKDCMTIARILKRKSESESEKEKPMVVLAE